MDVSVAMGTFNGARFLAEQLESLARQTTLPRELVVCDDGSSDETMRLLECFAKQASFDVRIYRNDTNLGWVANFLKCASLCRSDLIAFCDQDDVWEPEKLQKCAAAFADDVMLVTHETNLVDETLKSLGRRHPNLGKYGRFKPLKTDPMMFVCGMALVVRKTIVDHFRSAQKPTNLYRTGGMPHDHWVLFIARVLGDIVYLPDELSVWRQHGSNAVGSELTSDTKNATSSRQSMDAAYRSVGETFQDWSNCLETLTKQPGLIPGWSKKLRAGEEYYRQLSELWTSRSLIYLSQQNHFSRFKEWSRLIAQSGYRSRYRGGLGIKSMCKDGVFAVMGSQNKS